MFEVKNKLQSPLLFLLGVSLVGALAQLQFPPLTLAQEMGKGQLEAQQVPVSRAVPPKARVHSVKSDASDSLKLYSATAQGIEVSEDGGQSWQQLPIGGRNEEVFALSLHPLDPDILFVGRRDGLWKSKDGGRSWEALPYPASVPLSVAIPKSQPDTLYLATARRGVYKSNDGGYQWTQVSEGLPEARAGGRPEEIRTLVVHPLDPNVVYAALARHGIYRTADGGASWHKFNQGLPFIMGGPIRSPKLAFDPENSQRLYVAFNQRVHSHLVKARLYVLSDNKQWLPMEVGLPANFLILALIVDGTKRTLQVWGPDAVWEVPLAEKHCSTP